MLQNFKTMVEGVIREGKDGGLSDEEILCEFLEQVRFMAMKLSLKLLSLKQPPG